MQYPKKSYHNETCEQQHKTISASGETLAKAQTISYKQKV